MLSNQPEKEIKKVNMEQSELNQALQESLDLQRRASLEKQAEELELEEILKISQLEYEFYLKKMSKDAEYAEKLLNASPNLPPEPYQKNEKIEEKNNLLKEQEKEADTIENQKLKEEVYMPLILKKDEEEKVGDLKLKDEQQTKIIEKEEEILKSPPKNMFKIKNKEDSDKKEKSVVKEEEDERLKSKKFEELKELKQRIEEEKSGNFLKKEGKLTPLAINPLFEGKENLIKGTRIIN